jgi:hypothetical protein
VRPLRFAVLVATATALAIAFGQLWLRSVDSRVPTFERAARAGSDAVGVAIAGLQRSNDTPSRIAARTGARAAQIARAARVAEIA